MATQRRDCLRSIMHTAWSFRRSDPARHFSDCLRAAWKWTREMAKTANRFMRGVRRSGGFIHLSKSLIRSPASNRRGYGTLADRHAGSSISRVSR